MSGHSRDGCHAVYILFFSRFYYWEKMKSTSVFCQISRLSGHHSLWNHDKVFVFVCVYPLRVTVIFWNWHLWVIVIIMLEIPESEVNAMNAFRKCRANEIFDLLWAQRLLPENFCLGPAAKEQICCTYTSVILCIPSWTVSTVRCRAFR